MQEKELKIEGMTCDHCVMRVQKALEGVGGVFNAKVSLENKNALVNFDPSTANIESMIEAVKNVGYQASE